MAHHQKARDIHAEIARGLDMLLRYICLCAMRRDTDRADAEIISAFEIVHSTDAGEQERGKDAVFENLCNCANPVPIGMRAKTLVVAGALQAIAMRDLNCVHLGIVERFGNRLNMIKTILVADGMHPVAQGNVLYVKFGCCGVEGHAATPSCIRTAIFSAVFIAAEVIMSRLPA